MPDWFIAQLERFEQKLALTAEGQRSPLIMGVLNITPDSFSDGGRFIDPQQAIDQAYMMLDYGADIIDIGAESSRPGAKQVSLNEELSRLQPIFQAIQSRPIPFSVDTYKPEVMAAAIKAGAIMLNDIKGFSSKASVHACENFQGYVCVMHMQGTPQTMQLNPNYSDCISDIIKFFEEKICHFQAIGFHTKRVICDPGFGFGKTDEHNWQILSCLKDFSSLNQHILVGLSRKSMLGRLVDQPVDQRLSASLGAALAATQNGAHILRVHDVRETVDAVSVFYQGTSLVL